SHSIQSGWMRRPTEDDSPSPIRWERAGVRVSVPQNPKLFLHESLVLRRPDIERIAQPVTEKVQRKERQAEDGAGRNQNPRRVFHPIGAFFDQRSPRTHGRLYAEAEKTQERFEEHDARDGKCGVNDDRAERVRDDVPEDDAALAQTERDGGFDELLFLKR